MKHNTILSLILLTALAPACMDPEGADDAVTDDETSETAQELGGDGRTANLAIPLVVLLWHDKVFGGTKREFSTDEPNLGGGSGCQSGANFGGYAVTLSTGTWSDLSLLGINDSVSSLQFNIPPPNGVVYSTANTAATIAPI